MRVVQIERWVAVIGAAILLLTMAGFIAGIAAGGTWWYLAPAIGAAVFAAALLEHAQILNDYLRDLGRTP